MGIPLTMDPNYNDYSCQFKFGVPPPTPHVDPALTTPCLSICPTAVPAPQCPQLHPLWLGVGAASLLLLLPPLTLAAPLGIIPVDDPGMWLFGVGADANSLVQSRLSGGLSPPTVAIILGAGVVTSLSPCTLSVLPLTGVERTHATTPHSGRAVFQLVLTITVSCVHALFLTHQARINKLAALYYQLFVQSTFNDPTHLTFDFPSSPSQLAT